MNSIEYAGEIARELDRTVRAITPAEAERLCDLILQARRVLVAGAGRSGLATKACAMRLMHLGLDAYVVGETVTPPLGPADLLLIGSGSGETAGLVTIAEKARAIGARLALVSIFPQSSLGRLAEVVVRIPAPTPKAPAGGGATSVQPMGSLFEQSLLVFLDAVVMRVMERKGIDAASMFERHANLE